MTTTTTPLVPLPVGAVSTEEWQPDTSSHYRNFEGEIRDVVAGTRYGAHAVAVYAHAVHHDDGRIDDGTDPVFVAPSISVLTRDDEDGRPTDIGVTLTGEAARRLADVLVTAADDVDRWSTR
jgi:hypothetical protein